MGAIIVFASIQSRHQPTNYASKCSSGQNGGSRRSRSTDQRGVKVQLTLHTTTGRSQSKIAKHTLCSEGGKFQAQLIVHCDGQIVLLIWTKSSSHPKLE
jgi:hypothetical protein